MESFTGFEKGIIQGIVDNNSKKKSCYLEDIWERIFLDNSLYFDISDISSPKLMVHRDIMFLNNIALQEYYYGLVDKCNNILSTICHLEANGYIKMYGDYKINCLGVAPFDPKEYSPFDIKQHSNEFKHLASIAQRLICPTPKLDDLIKNGFKTEDDIKMEKEKRKNRNNFIWAMIGLGISVGGLIFNGITTFTKQDTVIVIKEKSDCKKNNPIVVELGTPVKVMLIQDNNGSIIPNSANASQPSTSQQSNTLPAKHSFYVHTAEGYLLALPGDPAHSP